jgi:hypothetical protein
MPLEAFKARWERFVLLHKQFSGTDKGCSASGRSKTGVWWWRWENTRSIIYAGEKCMKTSNAAEEGKRGAP